MRWNTLRSYLVKYEIFFHLQKSIETKRKQNTFCIPKQNRTALLHIGERKKNILEFFCVILFLNETHLEKMQKQMPGESEAAFIQTLISRQGLYTISSAIVAWRHANNILWIILVHKPVS